MKAAHRRAFTKTFYDKDVKRWISYYNSFNKPHVAGSGKTPEEARANLKKMAKHEIDYHDWVGWE